MNANIPHQPRTHCPDLERLAAFVDGRLLGAERTAIVAHLADCDACREIVAESAAMVAETASGEPEDAEIVPIRRAPTGRRWPIAAAAALVVAIGGAAGLVWMRSDRTEATLARLAADPATRSALVDGWSEPHWSVMRGAGPTVSEPARAFRLGARAAALEVALGAGDRIAARRLAAESALLVGDVPLADPIAHVYRTIAEALAAEAASTATLRDNAKLGAELTREAVDPALWALGRWAETARLGAASGVVASPPRRPSLERPLPPELAAELERIEALRRRRAPASELVAELERLLAAGGDLR